MPALSGPGPSRRPAQACPSRPEARDVKRAAASSSAGARRCSAPWDMIRPASWCVTAASDGHSREASCRASGRRACTVQRRAGKHHIAATHGAGWLSLEGARLLQRERVQGERVQGERRRARGRSARPPAAASHPQEPPPRLPVRHTRMRPAAARREPVEPQPLQPRVRRPPSAAARHALQRRSTRSSASTGSAEGLAVCTQDGVRVRSHASAAS
eukprot:scaffold60928_cov68-Phaeocystis_antarctica.AAC.10